MQKFKDSLKACFGNVNIIIYICRVSVRFIGSRNNLRQVQQAPIDTLLYCANGCDNRCAAAV